MKTRVQIALVCCLLSVIVHGYLTLHYYPLKFGFSGGQSLCNLNETFNCDAVSASAYAAWFGIPVAIWGAATNLVLFLLLLLGWLEWTENPERTRRWAVLLAGVSLAASIAMGAISGLVLQNYCLFCMISYGLSAVIFFAAQGVLREPFWLHLGRDLPVMTSEGRGILITLAAVPVIAYLTHQAFMQDFSETKVTALVDETMRDWEAAPQREFVAKPSLVMGSAKENAVLTLVEFADFRCSHCKHASYTFDAFVKAHPDVRFEFYSFPLDGACNEKIASASGISCRLAHAVLCAENEAKGWSMHHLLFELQDEVNRCASTAELDIILAKHVAPLSLNWESLQRCMADPTTLDAIKAQAKQGSLVNVMGTPTLFANGRQLNRAQLIPVLAAARERAAATRSR